MAEDVLGPGLESLVHCEYSQYSLNVKELAWSCLDTGRNMGPSVGVYLYCMFRDPNFDPSLLGWFLEWFGTVTKLRSHK